jgi:hypothetical protein
VNTLDDAKVQEVFVREHASAQGDGARLESLRPEIDAAESRWQL